MDAGTSQQVSNQDYEAFIKAKVQLAGTDGFDIEDAEINPILKPHQRAAVRWALSGGRRALFESFGLGKSIQQLEICRIVLSKLDVGPIHHRALIVCPLGVRQEFIRDSIEILDWYESPVFIRKTEHLRCDQCEGTREIEGDWCAACDGTGQMFGIFLTNYESIRENKIDLSLFDVISLDEASVLRSFGSKTFSEFLFGHVQQVKYRFVATATPSPNEFQELLAYSHFLGVMDIGQARTRFFKRNSEKSDDLTLHPHKEKEFWLWVSSWAMFLQKPSDLGFDDTGYDLPEMKVHYHEVAVDHTQAGADKHGQNQMFRNAASGVVETSREKRETLDDRIVKMQEILGENPDDNFLIWHDLEAEREAIEDTLPTITYRNWEQFKDGHPDALALYERHYSAYQYKDGRERKLFCGPGEKLVLMTSQRNALFVWRKFKDDSGQTGVNCAIFRNEGKILSSKLIEEAVEIAWYRWPNEERLYTYVNPEKIESENPGYCFKKAGWTKCGETKGGLDILEFAPKIRRVNGLPVEKTLQSVFGTQDLDVREQAIIDFSDGKIKYLAAKPVIAGSGCNFQRHCHKAIFLGIGYKFNDFIQAVHRIQRFLQEHPVELHIIYAESEKLVLASLRDKWERDKEQRQVMADIIREYGLSHEALNAGITRGFGVERREISGEMYRCINNDSVEECRSMESNSVGLVLTSIPFSTQYEYSPNYNDFGHTDNNEHFFAQMDFLTPELYRALEPGRVAAIHCKDRVVPSAMTGLGFQIVYPFHCDVIRHFQKHGFGYMGMKTIVTDVVRENNQTYRLGWTEQCKDGTKMGVGMPEYLLLFRKPPTENQNSYADNPVIKTKDDYTVGRWQIDAHGFMRQSGDRLLTPEEISSLPWHTVFRLFRDRSLSKVYDYEEHVALADAMEEAESLPRDFMLLQPQSWHPDVWTDITRMRTLNSTQTQKGKQVHLCPLQFDIVDRVIKQMSMPGEIVLDPFAGLMTVPYRAIKFGRRGIGIELNAQYFVDGAAYCEAMEQKVSSPSLFDLAEIEDEEASQGEKIC
jgi:DNA modification methylase